MPVGYVALPTAVDTTGPAAAAPSSPHVLTFAIDASLLGELAPAQVDVVAGGAVLAACAGPTDAAPDPCVAGRAEGTDGDLVVTVRSTTSRRGRSRGVRSSPPRPRRPRAPRHDRPDRRGDRRRLRGGRHRQGVGIRRDRQLDDVGLADLAAADALGRWFGGARRSQHHGDQPERRHGGLHGCFTVTAKPTVTALSPGHPPAGDAAPR